MDLMNRPVKVRGRRKAPDGVVAKIDARKRRGTRLAEICEPVFLYACRLNRSVALGAEHDPKQVRGDFESLLARVAADASESGLEESFARVRLPLVYFCDHVAATLPAAWAAGYEPIAHDMGRFEGEDAFFDEHVQALLDQAEPPRDEAEVLYLCMATGMTGRYGSGDGRAFAGLLDRVARAGGVPGATTTPEISDKPAKPVARVNLSGGLASGFDLVPRADGDRLCPAAYAYTDSRELSRPVRGRVWTTAAAAVLLVLATLVGGGVIYASQTRQLNDLLDRYAADSTPAANPEANPTPAPGE